MSVTVKSLNGDTTFLLTFEPVPDASTLGLGRSSFTIVIDPWLSGAVQVLSSKFALIQQKEKPCLSSLNDLPWEPDLILISQDQPDHCHKETLCQLPPDTRSSILAVPAAFKKIRKWNHFDSSRVTRMRRYVSSAPDAVYRHELPPLSPSGTPGQVTIAFISSKWDIKGLHNAIGITYKPPTAGLAAPATLAVDIPANPPDSPMSSWDIPPVPKLIPTPQQPLDEGKAISVVYTPHGLSYGTIRAYATSHLVSESAFPVTALLHSFDRVENPWYFGGNIAAGMPGGLDLARNLSCKAWIGAHDADKDKSGVSVQLLRTLKYKPDDVRKALQAVGASHNSGATFMPDIASLNAGDERRIGLT